MLRYKSNPQGQEHGSLMRLSAPLIKSASSILNSVPTAFPEAVGAQGREPWAWCDGASGPISVPSVWLAFN